MKEVQRCDGIMPLTRRRLLQVLHSTRALDTALAEFVRVRCASQPNTPSLGGYLSLLRSRGTSAHGGRPSAKLSNTQYDAYDRSVVRPRNRYMHQAGAYPPDQELTRLLDQMHACLSDVLRL